MQMSDPEVELYTPNHKGFLVLAVSYQGRDGKGRICAPITKPNTSGTSEKKSIKDEVLSNQPQGV